MNEDVKIVSIICIVALGCAMYLFYLFQRYRALSILRKRESLSDEDIYNKFYISVGLDKKIVISLWHKIAEILCVPAEYMRPSDMLGKDVGISSFTTSDEIDTLCSMIEERAEHYGRTVDMYSIKTVDDCVNILCKCTGQKSDPKPFL